MGILVRFLGFFFFYGHFGAFLGSVCTKKLVYIFFMVAPIELSHQ